MTRITFQKNFIVEYKAIIVFKKRNPNTSRSAYSRPPSRDSAHREPLLLQEGRTRHSVPAKEARCPSETAGRHLLCQGRYCAWHSGTAGVSERWHCGLKGALQNCGREWVWYAQGSTVALNSRALYGTVSLSGRCGLKGALQHRGRERALQYCWREGALESSGRHNCSVADVSSSTATINSLSCEFVVCSHMNDWS